MALAMDILEWAQEQFGECELLIGDLRRTKRVVKFAAQAAAMPDASTPKQAEGWGDCKAAYRLFAQEEVTFEALTAPHCAMSRAVPADMWGRVIDRVGPAPAEARFVHVCDRGADNFEVYCHLLQQRAGWVVRAAQLKRRVLNAEGCERSLDEAVRARRCWEPTSCRCAPTATNLPARRRLKFAARS